MSPEPLPERASLEYLKKLAKDRLRTLRQSDPQAKLAAALLAVAQDHGFSSWRALHAALAQRQRDGLTRFVDACRLGDLDTVQPLLARDPALARGSQPDAPHGGWTALHAAARAGQVAIARLLLAHGANPNAREAGDHTTPLHWAAARGDLPLVRVLLDAGADVDGRGDVHELDVIGWATFYHAPGDPPVRLDPERQEVVRLLLARGARHHIFSALSTGDPEVVQQVVEQNPEVLDRRLSRFEQRQTPLHFALGRQRYDLLDVLIELGADLEAENASGQTALAVAMVRGDREAMARLHAAGAQAPAVPAAPDLATAIAPLASSVAKVVPMLHVPDVGRALAWYSAVGFEERGRFDAGGVVNFGMVALGGAELMFNVGEAARARDVSIWLYTDRIDTIYQVFKTRQLEAAAATLAGAPAQSDAVAIAQEIEDMFYGARQFSLRDPHGYELYFIQPSAR